MENVIALNVLYNITNTYPSDERFGLTSQMRRSAISVPSDIAEVGGRRTNRKFAHFLGIAHGSICELESQISASLELELISTGDFERMTGNLTEIQKMLYSLIVKFRG